jgi:hypothetical protein
MLKELLDMTYPTSPESIIGSRWNGGRPTIAIEARSTQSASRWTYCGPLTFHGEAYQDKPTGSALRVLTLLVTKGLGT